MEHLSDLARIDFGKPEVVRYADFNGRLRPGACQVDGIPHEVRHRNQAADGGAAFGESQQLRGQEYCPLAGVGGLVQDALHRLVRLQPHLG